MIRFSFSLGRTIDNHLTLQLYHIPWVDDLQNGALPSPDFSKIYEFLSTIHVLIYAVADDVCRALRQRILLGWNAKLFNFFVCRSVFPPPDNALHIAFILD